MSMQDLILCQILTILGYMIGLIKKSVRLSNERKLMMQLSESKLFWRKSAPNAKAGASPKKTAIN